MRSRSWLATAPVWSDGRRGAFVPLLDDASPRQVVHPQGDLGQVETDDPIERGERFDTELVEHIGDDPLIPACSQCGVGDSMIEDRFDVDPRRACDQTDQDAAEANSIRHTRTVTAEWADVATEAAVRSQRTLRSTLARRERA
jgi:hypothetical protein